MPVVHRNLYLKLISRLLFRDFSTMSNVVWNVIHPQIITSISRSASIHLYTHAAGSTMCQKTKSKGSNAATIAEFFLSHYEEQAVVAARSDALVTHNLLCNIFAKISATLPDLRCSLADHSVPIHLKIIVTFFNF